MPQEKTDTKTLLLSVIEEYGHSDMVLGPQIYSMSGGGQEAVEECLLIMAHAHIHEAIALMKKAGLTSQKVAEDFYIHADIQAAP
jgi:hypothetical protein